MISLALFLAQHGGEHGGAEHEVPALLDPHSWGLVFWSAVTFAVVLSILKKAAWGPILAGLEKREKTISDAIEAAQRERTEAAKLLAEHQKALATVKNEAQGIIDEANLDAKRIAEEAHAKASAEAEATKQRAIRDIEMAKAKALEELRTGTIALAMTLAEKVLAREVDRKKHTEIVEAFSNQYESFGKN